MRNFKVNITLACCCLVFFSRTTAYTQDIHLTGKVIDQQTSQTLPHADIKAGGQRFMTDRNGSFSVILPEEILKKGITVSMVGYKDFLLKNAPAGDFIVLKLEQKTNDLPDVVVGHPGAAAIIRKALKKISANYPMTTANFYGFQRSFVCTKDSSLVLADDALLNVFMPGYNMPGKSIQVSVKMHKMSLHTSPDVDSMVFRDELGLGKGLYAAVSNMDFVHNRSSVARLRDLQYYQFRYNGIIRYKDCQVYSIGFSVRDYRSGIEGQIFIDTSDDAFKGIIYYFAQTEGHQHYFTYITTDYQKSGIRWALSSASCEQYYRSGGAYEKSVIFDFVSLQGLIKAPGLDKRHPASKKDQITDFTGSLDNNPKDWEQVDRLLKKQMPPVSTR